MAIKIGANLPFDPEFWPNLFLPGLPVLNIVFTPGTLPIVCYVPPQPLLSFQGLATLSTNVFLQAQVDKVDVVSQSWSLPKLFGAVLADVLVNCWLLLRGIGRPLNSCFPGHKSKVFSVCQFKCGHGEIIFTIDSILLLSSSVLNDKSLETRRCLETELCDWKVSKQKFTVASYSNESLSFKWEWPI